LKSLGKKITHLGKHENPMQKCSCARGSQKTRHDKQKRVGEKTRKKRAGGFSIKLCEEKKAKKKATRWKRREFSGRVVRENSTLLLRRGEVP